MLDLKLFLMYTRVFRFRLIWTIILAVVTQVFLYTMLVHYFEESIVSFLNEYADHLLWAAGMALGAFVIFEYVRNQRAGAAATGVK
jgi:hypothetical protein